MVVYTEQERLNLFECYIANKKSVALALREYRQKYPGRRLPHKKIFQRIVDDLSRGVLKYKKRNKPRHVLTENVQLDILLYFQENPESSLRNAAKYLDTTLSNIYKTLQINKYSAFKFLPVQHLYPEDLDLRLQYCMQMMDMQFERGIFQYILWTDESIFTTAGMWNRKNSHYWSRDNFKKVRIMKKQGRRNVNVWCGIVGNNILGPIFFQNYLNGERYLNMLRGEIQEEINRLPDHIKRNLIFQQDSAPYHTVQPVRNHLRQNFGMTVMKDGTIPWPPRSPDLNPLDFFVWGTLKNNVYRNQSNYIIEEVKVRIRDEINLLRQSGAIQRAIHSLESRYTLCISENGGYIENKL